MSIVSEKRALAYLMVSLMIGCTNQSSRSSSKQAWAQVLEEKVSEPKDTLGFFNSIESMEIRIMSIPTLKKATKPLMISDSKLHHIFPKTLDSIHDSSTGYYLYEFGYKGGIIIKNKSDSKVKAHHTIETLGLYSKINLLTKTYLQIGFTCGGPCSGKSFVFINEDREAETYFYANITENNKDIVTHIQNESFDSLWIRNLSNSKEMKIKVLDELTIENYLYALKSVQHKGNFLYFEMAFQNEPTLKRRIDIREIIN